MNKISKTDINSAGKVLYGAAIVLLVQNHPYLASIAFLAAIIMILVSLKEDDISESYDYLVALGHEIHIGVMVAAFIEFLLGSFVSAAILALIALVSSKLKSYIRGHKDVQ